MADAVELGEVRGLEQGTRQARQQRRRGEAAAAGAGTGEHENLEEFAHRGRVGQALQAGAQPAALIRGRPVEQRSARASMPSARGTGPAGSAPDRGAAAARGLGQGGEVDMVGEVGLARAAARDLAGAADRLQGVAGGRSARGRSR